jgi:hypothetical protein
MNTTSDCLPERSLRRKRSRRTPFGVGVALSFGVGVGLQARESMHEPDALQRRAFCRHDDQCGAGAIARGLSTAASAVRAFRPPEYPCLSVRIRVERFRLCISIAR